MESVKEITMKEPLIVGDNIANDQCESGADRRTLSGLFKRCLSVSVVTNNHKTVYESAAKFYRQQHDDIDDATLAAIEDAPVVYDLHVYPKNPVGCYTYTGADLDELVRRCHADCDAEGIENAKYLACQAI